MNRFILSKQDERKHHEHCVEQNTFKPLLPNSAPPNLLHLWLVIYWKVRTRAKKAGQTTAQNHQQQHEKTFTAAAGNTSFLSSLLRFDAVCIIDPNQRSVHTM